MVGASKGMKLQCGHEASVWKEEPSESQHAYRVECTVCGKFAKWGTDAELRLLQASSAQAKVVRYDAPEDGPNLDEFFE